MHGTASRKVPSGKLVRVAVDYDDHYRSVTISGDFFLEPPESLESLTAAVEESHISASRDELVKNIESVDAKLIGFTAEDLAIALRTAVGQNDDTNDSIGEPYNE
jgi:lipoate-protein ligase A